jgi:mRNA-degrading endonuclease RelE of RelBE toxin-antitoxin system
VTYRVQVREQVWNFHARLAPENRRAVKSAIMNLAGERGDIRSLRDRLEGFHRLRVGRYRIIFRYLEGRIIECVYMNARALVYDVFESQLHRIISERPAKED